MPISDGIRKNFIKNLTANFISRVNERPVRIRD